MHKPSHVNNFDLIRLLLAAAVVVAHMVALLPADYGPVATFTGIFGGGNAVDCFFVISGYLIFQSYNRSRTARSYAVKRARRIYPALFATIILCALAGAALTTLPLREYVPGALRYVGFNLVFMTFKQQTLPGVFENAPYHYVNGPLWTLKVEVMFYIAVPFIVWFARRFIRFPVLAVLIYVGSVAYHLTLSRLAAAHDSSFYDELARQLPGQMSFFIAGGLIDNGFVAFRKYRTVLVPASIAALALCAAFGNLSLVYALYPGALAILVIYACVLLPRLVNIGKYGDFSYGLYIVHYPILQTFGTLGLLAGTPLLRSLAAFACCFAAAVLSWHLIEKHWLRPSSRPAQQPAVAV